MMIEMRLTISLGSTSASVCANSAVIFWCITAGKPDAAGRIDYSELGVARILVDFLGSPALEEFYNDITLPIQGLRAF